MAFDKLRLTKIYEKKYFNSEDTSVKLKVKNAKFKGQNYCNSDYFPIC